MRTFPTVVTQIESPNVIFYSIKLKNCTTYCTFSFITCFPLILNWFDFFIESFFICSNICDRKKNNTLLYIIIHPNGSWGYDDSFKLYVFFILFAPRLPRRWTILHEKIRMNQSSFWMNKIATKKNDFHSFSEHLLFFVHSEMFAHLLENG